MSRLPHLAPAPPSRQDTTVQTADHFSSVYSLDFSRDRHPPTTNNNIGFTAEQLSRNISNTAVRISTSLKEAIAYDPSFGQEKQPHDNSHVIKKELQRLTRFLKSLNETLPKLPTTLRPPFNASTRQSLQKLERDIQNAFSGLEHRIEQWIKQSSSLVNQLQRVESRCESMRSADYDYLYETKIDTVMQSHSDLLSAARLSLGVKKVVLPLGLKIDDSRITCQIGETTDSLIAINNQISLLRRLISDRR